MATKSTDECLRKAGDDEPIFVLRAKDMLAPIVIRIWADLADLHGASMGKCVEARRLAEQMERYPDRKFPD